MLKRLVSMICAIPLSLISDTLWSQRSPGGEGDVSPCLQPVKLLWRQIPTTTSILNKKKTTKTAKMKNETLLRAKTMQRAAILFKQVSDPTRLQVITPARKFRILSTY